MLTDSFLVWISKELKKRHYQDLLSSCRCVSRLMLCVEFCVLCLYPLSYRIVPYFGAWWFWVLGFFFVSYRTLVHGGFVFYVFFMFFYPYDIRLSCSTHGPNQNLWWLCLSHSSQLCPLGMLSNRWLVNSLGCYPAGLLSSLDTYLVVCKNLEVKALTTVVYISAKKIRQWVGQA